MPSVGISFKKLLLAVIGESTIWTPLRFIIRIYPFLVNNALRKY